MRAVVTTPAVWPPVSLAEVRRWLNFVSNVTEDDLVIEQLIDETVSYLENYCNRYFVTQTVTVYLDSNEICDTIHLPCVPLVSVSSITTTDDDGDTTLVASTNYQVRAGENPRITLTASGAWPTDIRDYDGVAIVCIVGANGHKVPHVGFTPTNQTTTQLDDLTAGGTFTGTVRTTIEVKIDSTGAPDVFKFRKKTWDADGVMTVTAWSSGANITGAAQTLVDGVTATWAATTGHTDESKWTIQPYEILPPRVRMLLKGLVLHFYLSKGRGVSETVSGQVIGMPYQFQSMMDGLRVTPWV